MVVVQAHRSCALSAVAPCRRRSSIVASWSAVLRDVARDGFHLSRLDEHLRSDRCIVLAAVASSNEALQFAADHLRADEEVVRAAVSYGGTLDDGVQWEKKKK